MKLMKSTIKSVGTVWVFLVVVCFLSTAQAQKKFSKNAIKKQKAA